MAELVLSVNNVVKQFQRKTAVDNVSFSVGKGEIVGFLGPNGAGKTTTLRMIMGITAPDSGTITFHGANSAAAYRAPGGAGDGAGGNTTIPKHRVGYLPEERGLYKEARVLDILLFLSGIKGIRRHEARERALHWLHHFELGDYANAKVNELSKGMAQKVQFIAAVMHEPDLVVLDEPFSGLDPVNQDLFKNEIRKLAEAGAAVLLSSHQMNLVEETCDRIFLINAGRRVLYGPLLDIKSQYGLHRVHLYTNDAEWQLPGTDLIEQATNNGARWTCLLRPNVTPAQFMRSLPEDAPIEEFNVARISLHDIFVRMATGREVA